MRLAFSDARFVFVFPQPDNRTVMVMVMNNAKPRRFLVFMILTLLRTGSHVQRKMTSTEILEGMLIAGPADGGWRMAAETDFGTAKSKDPFTLTAF